MADEDKSWPECVGKTGEEAKAIISQERPDLELHILPENSMVTMDYRLDRCRIFVDANNKVVGAPRLG